MNRLLLTLIVFSAFDSGCTGTIDDVENNPDEILEQAVPDPEAESLGRITRSEYRQTLLVAFGPALVEELNFGLLPDDHRDGAFPSNRGRAINEEEAASYGRFAETVARISIEASLSPKDCDLEMEGCALASFEKLAAHFYRRQLQKSELDAYSPLLDVGKSEVDDFRLLLTALLQSPHFLYKPEGTTDAQPGTVIELSEDEVAIKLATFLWGGPPDSSLLEAAKNGKLRDEDELRAQATRMLDDPRSRNTFQQFLVNWLSLDAVYDNELDLEDGSSSVAELRDLFLEESTELFLRAIASEDEGSTVSQLLTSRWTYPSDALQAYYGMDSDELPANRSGILTRGAFLTAHVSDPDTTPIHRGKVIREQLFCQHLPAPPDVTDLADPSPDQSLRDQLQERTGVNGCVGCHRLMNPFGFAFSQFSETGEFRTMDREYVIDTSAEIVSTDVDGVVNGAIELSERLAESQEVIDCAAVQWLHYALGRSVNVHDEEAFSPALQEYREHGNIRELIISIAASPAFRLRRLPSED